MITILNRAEVCTTYSMQEQSEIRKLLTQQGIDYSLKTFNRKSPSPMGGSFGEDHSQAYEYIFYVHKDDIEKAKHIVSSRSR